jgi:hypothetical protein
MQVPWPCGPPTILGGTQLVQVPHYQLAIPRTREDLVVITWVLVEIEFFPFLPFRAETYYRDPKQRLY